jgi:hypothetical protein
VSAARDPLDSRHYPAGFAGFRIAETLNADARVPEPRERRFDDASIACAVLSAWQRDRAGRDCGTALPCDRLHLACAGSRGRFVAIETDGFTDLTIRYTLALAGC